MMFVKMGSQNLCQVETKKLILVIGLIFATVLVFQSSVLPYQDGLSNLLSMKSMSLIYGSNSTKGIDKMEEIERTEMMEKDRYPNNDSLVYGDTKPGKDSTAEKFVVLDKNSMLENAEILINGSSMEKLGEFEKEWFEDGDGNERVGNVGRGEAGLDWKEMTVPIVVAPSSFDVPSNLDAKSYDTAVSINSEKPFVGKEGRKNYSEGEKHGLLKSGTNQFITGNEMRQKTQPMSISMMNSLLLQSHISNSMRPRWPSVRDQELLSVRSKIESAPILRNDRKLYASIFQNVSMFKRSYELMESTLKVYIYEEGEKPVFHQPKLKGIYASEGWFLKLMEHNKQFVVKNPSAAHLFYLPFSSMMLRKTGQNQKTLIQFLKNYVDMISQKYVFWNRTDGADHFVAACHDWAPKETRSSMGNCIRALCNANVARDFKIGKDVSLPVTNVRTPADPLKSIGGKPPSKRPILAFFAGSMHGYLRPILLKYWENKDPDMKIFGPMSLNATGKMTYKQYMKSSKYCICARGYEVHTPRVMEAIFYECVPVIISDNYAPPFFEVLNWNSFSVFIAEEDIPRLKDILTSIPKKKYLMLQQGVKQVQRHFLWHNEPEKYDMFHMILHSIWYNRVFQMTPT